MKVLRLAPVVIVLLAATLTITAQQDGQKPAPSFRAGIDIVSLNVTVTDSAGHYVTELDQKDFAVYEDGVKQDVTFFNRQHQPIALSLLLDSSASMEDKLPVLQTAASNFVRKLRPTDIAQVIDFDSRVEIRQAFTSKHEDLEAAIKQTAAGGSTSLHNAVYIALKELKKVQAHAENELRRQAIVVFSDGEDTSSLVSFDELLDLAKRSETAIYTISLRSDTPTQSKGFREAEYVMRELAQQTGGRAFFAKRIEDLNNVYSEISDELSSQYVLAYTSKNQRRTGAWRAIVVQILRANATPRTKKGYYGPTGK